MMFAKKENNPLSAKAFEMAAEQKGVVILDVRKATEFSKGYVPGAINIDLEGSFAIWAGTILRDVSTKILLVTPEGRELETIDRLSRVGFDGVLGYLKGGFATWKSAGKPVATVKNITAEELAKMKNVNILDVRRESEYQSEHLKNAENVPLDYWWDSIKKVDPSKKYFVHCRTGNRSIIFCSILQKEGFNNLVNVSDGLEDLKKTGAFEVTEYVCPSTLL